MCTYNGEKYLAEQLDSIASQTLLPSELVICDDGSRDGTSELIASFANRVPFPVRFIQNSQNLGSTANFEQAMQMCRGSLIALSDQDDWWYPHKLESLSRALRDTGAGGVFSDADLMDEKSTLTGQTLWDANLFHSSKGFNKDFDRNLAIKTLLRANVVTGATLLFQSELRSQLLPIAREWVHDGWMAWMMVLHSRLLAFPESLIRYRIHSTQQVGIPGRSAMDRLRRARVTGARDYRAVATQFSSLLDYALSHPDVCHAALTRHIAERRDFAVFRAELTPTRWTRWAAISHRYFSYREYGQGWRSILKDVLR